MSLCRSGRRVLLALSALTGAMALGSASAVFGVCGPFTDVTDPGFCPAVLEIFTLGITTGTTPTTYDPTNSVNRLQMAAFLSRTVDAVLQRGSRRAALGQFWTPQNGAVLGLTTIGFEPQLVASDGADIWVAHLYGNKVSRVRANDGRLLETWTGATSAFGVLAAMGKVFVTGFINPGNLYRIDASQAAGSVTTVASNLGGIPAGIASDGARIWTANFSTIAHSVSIVTPGATIPWSVTTVTTGFSQPIGALYDGANVWVSDNDAGTLLKLDPVAAILQTVTVETGPRFPIFDGTNIWVPNFGSDSASVVRASSGALLATLTGNGLSLPIAAAFDGQRVLITNQNNSVSLWKAADLTPLGSFAMPTNPRGACSDGINFWIALDDAGYLARF